MPRRPRAIADTLAFYTIPEPNSGCLLWIGPVQRFGYGSLGTTTNKNKYVLAHRAAYEVAFGPIPEGLWVLHSCDVPACVNPRHLRLGDAADNAADRDRRGRGGVEGKCKLSPSVIKEIREPQMGRGVTAMLAKRFGVSRDTIGRVRGFKRLRKLPRKIK